MKTIRHSETLFYYDGPQVFEARDTIGGHYIGVAVEPEGDKERYLVAGVAPERLMEFRVGLRDLRSLLCEGSDGEWYLATAPQGLEEPLTLIPQEKPLAESEHLPKAGFLLPVSPARSGKSDFVTIRDESKVQLVGALEMADLINGRWHLATRHGLCSGRVKPEGPSLAGLELGRNYRFICLRHQESGNEAGVEGTVFYMLERQPLDFVSK